ncbi:MAG: hypothetical protein ACLFSM_01125 [Thermoplasmata archaeon]
MICIDWGSGVIDSSILSKREKSGSMKLFREGEGIDEVILLRNFFYEHIPESICDWIKSSVLSKKGVEASRFTTLSANLRPPESY